ncbi:MAG: ISAs1 family transposase [Leptolyngbyaceae cyanobacterium SM1_4_3]|nr:ISAs1 family transposase [Leptolyngbyaceae cyanobacterium SM1_4_3]
MLQSGCLTRSKKTVQEIHQSGNDFLIAVKGNQPKLLAQVQRQFESESPLSVATQIDSSHGRVCQRTVSVMTPPTDLDPQWVGIQRVIRVERSGTRARRPFQEVMVYISALTLDAAGFAQGIRQHWQVENRLHWVKDVVLGEDTTPVCAGHALPNFAILRTMALNLFRQHGFDSITKGMRQLAHDIRRLFSFFQ